MSVFGWSMPAGCTGTPYDEPCAEELKVPDLPAHVLAFWVEGETIEILRYLPEGETDLLVRFDHLGDDDLSEAQNSANAANTAAQKWKEYVEAAERPVQLDKKLLKGIRTLTQVNDHGGAYQEAAQALGCDDLVQRFSSINQQHLRLGELSPRLYEQRFAAYQELLKRARVKLSAADYQRLYGAL